MIDLKDLKNRVYDGKECVRFEYDVFESDWSDEKKHCFTARYHRDTNDKQIWYMQVVIPRDNESDSQVYNILYCIPKVGMSLAVIAAVGLKYLQAKFKEEVQKKSNWNLELGSLLKDM